MVLVKKSKAEEIIVGLCVGGGGIYQKQTGEEKKKKQQPNLNHPRDVFHCHTADKP